MMSTNWDLLIENHFNKKGNEEEKLSRLYFNLIFKDKKYEPKYKKV